MWPTRVLLVVLACAIVLVAGCGGGTEAEPAGAAEPPAGDPAADDAATAPGDPTSDKLAQVLARGTLILFTDPAYPPQSFAVEGAERPADTRCAANQLTAPEVSGYDAETGKLVAEELGVEACFVTPTWTEVTAGNWGDRWDLAFGSGAIAVDRMEVLYVTQPYYSTPANFFVPTDSPAQLPTDLSGKDIGACAGCTMEDYLRGTLELPGPPIEFVVENPNIVTFDTEPPGLEATARGELDGFLCSEPVGREQIDKGLHLRMLEEPAYVSYKTGYVDKSSGLSAAAFVERVDEILAGLHADGTLADLSVEFFGKDYATLAGEFDLASIGQTVT
jgi:polar amino acid transport system substrate-binding protein